MIVGMPTTSYPRGDDDIAGDFVRGMARALASKGHEVRVLAPEPAEKTSGVIDPSISVRYVPYIRPRSFARTFYGAGVPDNIHSSPLAALGLLTYPPALGVSLRAASSDWDAIVSHWALPSALCAGLARPGLPHVAVMHSADVHLLASSPMRRIMAEAIERSATSLWFVAPYLASIFEECLGRAPTIPVDVAPMGFEPTAPPTEPRELLRARLGLGSFTALTLARLVPIKGVDRLIEACQTLSITLVVAGDGPEREALQSRAKDADIRFVGYVRGEQKRDLLYAADAFALGSRAMPDSRSEGAPVSLLEAMDAGLPIIATNTGGVRALVGDAALVVGDETLAIMDGLASLRDDSALRERLRIAGLARAQSHRWPTRVARLEARLEAARK